MSRTDKTRPWWVQLVDAPGRTCMPAHDHRFGECTLPAEAAPERAPLRNRPGRCHWAGTAAYWVRRCESHGAREWNLERRLANRGERHRARREVHEARREMGRRTRA